MTKVSKVDLEELKERIKDFPVGDRTRIEWVISEVSCLRELVGVQKEYIKWWEQFLDWHKDSRIAPQLRSQIKELEEGI